VPASIRLRVLPHGHNGSAERGKTGVNTNPSYDAIVSGHYDKAAAEHGTLPTSTMPDEITRTKESEAILKFVELVARAPGKSSRNSGKELVIADVGCGNGYTLGRLARAVPSHRFVGIEYNDNLRSLAEQQLAATPSARVLSGDLRDPRSIALDAGSVDILICQRVLINLLDVEHQRAGLETIIGLVRPGGALIFIEAFASGLRLLNEARAEFGLDEIKPVPHNMYLPDHFFQHKALQGLDLASAGIRENLLSTHYFVTRVLHDVALMASNRKGFIRNSHFVRFFSAALPDGIGDYSPLRIHTFEKAAVAK
jgi:SAM-dependent methyltransferase